jgi:hypothetical protein
MKKHCSAPVLCNDSMQNPSVTREVYCESTKNKENNEKRKKGKGWF